MLHLDRNYSQPSPLSAPAQTRDHLILPTSNPTGGAFTSSQSLPWSPKDNDFYAYSPSGGNSTNTHSTPITSHDMAYEDKLDETSVAQNASNNPISPAGKVANGGGAGVEQHESGGNASRSSSLSSAPDAGAAGPSRQSTPLSEPPDDDEEDGVKHNEPAVKQEEGDNSKSEDAKSITSLRTPGASTSPAPTTVGDAKVHLLLELNKELFKFLFEFQNRAVPVNDPQFLAYSQRLQSNLGWSASVMDGRQSHALPTMEPPPSVDFMPNDHLRELYADLPNVFAKEIARRAALSNPINPMHPTNPSPLKRERPDDDGPHGMNKRRDTGESKAPGVMARSVTPSAAPTNRAQTPLTNGPTQGGRISTPGPDEMQRRQAQMRAQGRQMSPPTNPMGGPGPRPGSAGMGGGNPAMGANAIAGPSNPGINISALPPNVQNAYQILQTPNHPLVVQILRAVPNFQQMPLQSQLQRILSLQNQLQMRGQAMNGMPGNGGFPGGQGMGGNPSGFPGGQQTSPVSPMGGPAQNAMFPGDLRAMSSTPGPGGMGPGGMGPGGMGPGGMGSGGMGNGGMAPGAMAPGGMNGLSAQQRQLILLQQQRGGMNPGMVNMNPQQQMAYQQQERMRMMQQQQSGGGGSAPSPTMPGSPMMGSPDSFNALRSNPSMPGIARIARSPSEGGGMGTPRMTPARAPSMGGGDDFSRMMQQQPQRGGNFVQTPQGGWQQQQQPPGMGMPMGNGMPGGMGMGMPGGPGPGPRPGSAYGGAPSPPGGQNWGPNAGGISDMGGMPRHMSGTPGPGGGMQGHQQQNQMMGEDFESFNWS